jgi:hypothetical protein
MHASSTASIKVQEEHEAVLSGLNTPEDRVVTSCGGQQALYLGICINVQQCQSDEQAEEQGTCFEKTFY